jgi:predicted transcriptional regulator of viral defense system
MITALRSRRTVSTAELTRLVKEYVAVSLDYALRRLQREKVLRRPEDGSRGMYLVDGAFLSDPIEAIKTVMGDKTVFGYGTALFLHGLSRYALLSEYYVLATGRRNRRPFGAHLVRFVKAPLEGTVGVVKQKHGLASIQVTDLERTLIDCIHRPKYAQGWENVLHALNRVRKIDCDRMMAYVKQYRTPSLVAKVGLVLEHYGPTWRVSERALASLSPYLPRTPVRFSRGTAGSLTARWNLFVPTKLFDE